MSKPAIVLVHGAWHNPTHWDRVATPLRKGGYEVKAPQLPSVGVSKDPGGALSKDAETVADAIRTYTSQGRDVVVVMHSYGGMAGSEGVAKVCEEYQAASLSGGKGRVIKLLYVTAYVLYKDINMIMEHTPDKDSRSSPLEISDEGLMTHTQPLERFYQLTDPSKAEAAIATLKPMALSAFTEMQRYGGTGWAKFDIPVVYIGCTQDQSIPLAMQEDFVARMDKAGVSVQAVWLDTDHSPFVNSPEEILRYMETATEQA